MLLCQIIQEDDGKCDTEIWSDAGICHPKAQQIIKKQKKNIYMES